MNDEIYGRMLGEGDPEQLKRSYEKFMLQEVDWNRMEEPLAPLSYRQTTIKKAQTVSGPGTFFGSATRTLQLEPTNMEGWWFDRIDHPECLPVRVSIRNVWTTGAIVSNIVLRSGPPQNYIRLVEHMICLRMFMGIDNLMIRIDSGDPPLFDMGSLDIVEALEDAGTHEYDHPVKYLSVKERVTLMGANGEFVTIDPVDPNRLALDLDVAVDFPTAIGRQRIAFPANYDICKYASVARTNTSAGKSLFCQTFGRMFADVRNLGYTKNNVLVAGRFGYKNEPRLPHNNKSLEAVWHRAVLDLLAAIALIDGGRLLGRINSYRAGHRLDVEMVRELYKNDLLEEVTLPPEPPRA